MFAVHWVMRQCCNNHMERTVAEQDADSAAVTDLSASEGSAGEKKYYYNMFNHYGPYRYGYWNQNQDADVISSKSEDANINNIQNAQEVQDIKTEQI